MKMKEVIKLIKKEKTTIDHIIKSLFFKKSLLVLWWSIFNKKRLLGLIIKINQGMSSNSAYGGCIKYEQKGN